MDDKIRNAALKIKDTVENRAQELQFERLEYTQYNFLDGKFVAESLRRNKHLWKSFVIGRFQIFDLIELRDLETGFLNVDTLYILTNKKHLADLLVLIKGWSADEISYQTEDKEMRLGGGAG